MEEKRPAMPEEDVNRSEPRYYMAEEDVHTSEPCCYMAEEDVHTSTPRHYMAEDDLDNDVTGYRKPAVVVEDTVPKQEKPVDWIQLVNEWETGLSLSSNRADSEKLRKSFFAAWKTNDHEQFCSTLEKQYREQLQKEKKKTKTEEHLSPVTCILMILICAAILYVLFHPSFLSLMGGIFGALGTVLKYVFLVLCGIGLIALFFTAGLLAIPILALICWAGDWILEKFAGIRFTGIGTLLSKGRYLPSLILALIPVFLILVGLEGLISYPKDQREQRKREEDYLHWLNRETDRIDGSIRTLEGLKDTFSYDRWPEANSESSEFLRTAEAFDQRLIDTYQRAAEELRKAKAG